MKKLIFIIIIVITFLSLNLSACPDGYTSTSFTYLYDMNADGIGDCPVTVNYCYSYNPPNFDVWIEQVIVLTDCDNFSRTGIFWNNLTDRVREDFKNKVMFQPCPIYVYNVQIRRAECWKIQNIPSNPVEQTPGYVKYLVCSFTAFCEWTYKICYDTETHQIIDEPVSTRAVTEFCGFPMSLVQLPPQGYTWDDEWITECYGLTCQ